MAEDVPSDEDRQKFAQMMADLTAPDANARLFAELDRSKNEAARLNTEFKRLEAEREAQATSLRVERTAREKLAMRSATPAVTVYVHDDAGAASGVRP